MKIPQEIQNFINQKIEVENFCLPHFYPKTSSFQDVEKFQDGYKINSHTGKKLTGIDKGDFLEEWFVICSAYQNDPFFINIQEREKSFPVYFAWHGMGKWLPIKVANSILEFETQLKLLKSTNNMKAVLKEKFDLSSDFWQEVYKETEDFLPSEEIEIEKVDSAKVQINCKIRKLYDEIEKLNEDRYSKKIDLKTFYHLKKEKEETINTLRLKLKATANTV